MPAHKLSPELKAAIARLPAKEKDKLLFRLIAKDQALIERLTFQLLEGAATVEDRRAALRDRIERFLERTEHHFHSPGYLLLDLRELSGHINRHVKTTRDKYGEIELNLAMLNKALELHGNRIMQFSAGRSRTLDQYVLKRAAKLLTLLGKMHEDFQLDFRDDLQQLGRHIQRQPTMMAMAEQIPVDVERLLRGEI